jgi:sarcosine oxidase subunit beta
MRVAVAGAGVIGCATAWHLASRGVDVVVYERGAIASGASGGLGKRGVRANMRDPAELALARRAHELWPSLHERLGAPTGFERTGHLQLSEDDANLGEIVARQRDAGIECAVVSGGELRELEPDLCDGVIAAVHCPSDGIADHTATTRAFADAARRAGAEFREHTEVRVEDIDADRILVAANAGARELLDRIGVRLPTANVYPQVLVTQPLDRVVVRHLVGHAGRPLAIKTLPDRSVMITGGRFGRDGIVDDGEVEANFADAVVIFPALAEARVERAVADRAESVTRDLLPVVDELAGTNVVVAAGWSGHGWAIAPVVAECLAVWIETGERPDVLRPFCLDRFGKRDIS